MTVRIEDSGELVDEEFLEDYSITIGIHVEDSGETYEGGLTVAEIGAIHEFGTQTIPRRSWLRGYIDANEQEIRGDLRKAYESAIKSKGQKGSLARRLKLVALKHEFAIKERMMHLSPSLKSETVDRKGSSATLVDTGQLRSSITSEVKRRNG